MFQRENMCAWIWICQYREIAVKVWKCNIVNVMYVSPVYITSYTHFTEDYTVSGFIVLIQCMFLELVL